MMLHYKYDLKILITMELTNDNHLDNIDVVKVLETASKICFAECLSFWQEINRVFESQHQQIINFYQFYKYFLRNLNFIKIIEVSRDDHS